LITKVTEYSNRNAACNHFRQDPSSKCRYNYDVIVVSRSNSCKTSFSRCQINTASYLSVVGSCLLPLSLLIVIVLIGWHDE